MINNMTQQLFSGGPGRSSATFVACHRGLLTMFATLLVACGSDSNDAVKPASNLHACELLPATEVSRLAGETVAESRVDVETTTMSQCTHSFESAVNSLTVHVRRSATPIGQSRQADADKARAEDDGTGYGKQFGDAIESGEDIQGLGTLAYSYEIGGSLHLVAYWDKQYSVWVWTKSDPDDKERVLQIEKAAAQLVIDKL